MSDPVRDKIRDQGVAIMDAIARTKGENHPTFWAAMQVTTDNLAAYDKAQRERAEGRSNG